jgi:hypothetical protein
VITLRDFLSAFYPDENEQIRVRGFGPSAYPKPNDKLSPKPFGDIYSFEFPVTRSSLATDRKLREQVLKENRWHGVYFVVNAGVSKDKTLALGEYAKVRRDGNGKKIFTSFVEDSDITRFNSFFAECDDQSIDDQLARIEQCVLAPSIIVITRKSVHIYWLCTPAVDEVEWRDVQTRLIAYFNSDDKIKNPSRVMRLPFLDHLYFNSVACEIERQRVQLYGFNPDRRFTAEEMRKSFPSVRKLIARDCGYTTSGEYPTWEALGNELRRRMLAHETAKQKGDVVELKGICHDGKGNSALFFNIISGKYYCNNPDCMKEDILEAFGLPTRPTGQWRSRERINPAVARETQITDTHWSSNKAVAAFIARKLAPIESITEVVTDIVSSEDAQASMAGSLEFQMIRARPARVNEQRYCFSEGCRTLIDFIKGIAVCPSCGLKQRLVSLDKESLHGSVIHFPCVIDGQSQ